MTKQQHPLLSASFMEKKKPKKGGGYDYWAIEPSGNYTEDTQRGQQCAFEYIELLLKHGNSASLRCIVLDMAKKNTDMHSEESHRRLIVGFFSALEDLLYRSIEPEHVSDVQHLYAWQRQELERFYAETKDRRSPRAQNAANARWGKLKVVK